MRQNFIEIAVAVLGRSPSPQQLAAWMADAENGQTLGELTAVLLLSQEGQERFPTSGTVAVYLTNAYQQLFGRAPDAAGLAYWEEQVSQGNVDFSTLVVALVNGARAETGNPNDAAVVNARSEAAESYLVSVENGDVEFSPAAAAGAVSAVRRENVANPALEPELPDDGETPPDSGEGEQPGDGVGGNNGGGNNGGGGTPTPQPDPKATFEVAENGIQKALPGEEGTAEYQVLAFTTPQEGQVFTLSHSGVDYTAAALGANPQMGDLAQALNNAANNAQPPAPFGVSWWFNEEELRLTWRDQDAAPSGIAATLSADAVTEQSAAAVDLTATTDAGAGESVQGTDDGIAEVQTIDLSGVMYADGQRFTLTVGNTVLETAELSIQNVFQPSADVVAALQAATGYADAPFTIDATQNTLTLTWEDKNAAPSQQTASLAADAVIRTIEPAVEAIIATVIDGEMGTATSWSATFDIANVLDGEDYAYSLTLTEQIENPNWTGSVNFGDISGLEEVSVNVNGKFYTLNLTDSGSLPEFRDGNDNVLNGVTFEGGNDGDDAVINITLNQSFEINGATTKAIGEVPTYVSFENITTVSGNFDIFDRSFSVMAKSVETEADVAQVLATYINGLENEDAMPFTAIVDEGQLVITADEAGVNYTVATNIGVPSIESNMDFVI